MGRRPAHFLRVAESDAGPEFRILGPGVAVHCVSRWSELPGPRHAGTDAVGLRRYGLGCRWFRGGHRRAGGDWRSELCQYHGDNSQLVRMVGGPLLSDGRRPLASAKFCHACDGTLACGGILAGRGRRGGSDPGGRRGLDAAVLRPGRGRHFGPSIGPRLRHRDVSDYRAVADGGLPPFRVFLHVLVLARTDVDCYRAVRRDGAIIRRQPPRLDGTCRTVP